MTVQRVARSQLVDLVGQLSMRPERTTILIDGYPGAGKTTLAMALARVPGTAWVPLDGYRHEASFDFKRLNKELLRPFRKRGRVRQVVPQNPLSRKGTLMTAKGAPQEGVRVLILEGMESALSAPALGAQYICWVDCARSVRIDRMNARNAPNGQFVELQDWIERAELSGLREQVLGLANFVVDTSSPR